MTGKKDGWCVFILFSDSNLLESAYLPLETQTQTDWWSPDFFRVRFSALQPQHPTCLQPEKKEMCPQTRRVIDPRVYPSTSANSLRTQETNRVSALQMEQKAISQYQIHQLNGLPHHCLWWRVESVCGYMCVRVCWRRLGLNKSALLSSPQGVNTPRYDFSVHRTELAEVK